MSAQMSAAADGAAPREPFRIADIDERPWLSRLMAKALDYPQREWLFWLLRAIRPIAKVPISGGCFWVFRDEDVREVLGHDREFPVAWDREMRQVTRHRNFVLGMANDAEYRRSYEQLARAFEREDVYRYVVPQAARATEALLRGKTSLDAVRELMWGVPALLCRDYYGLDVQDHLLLADWSVAISSYLFAPRRRLEPFVRPKSTDLSEIAAAGMRELIRRSIAHTKAGRRYGIVLPRMIDLGFPDDVIEAHMVGMITGFIPTNLLAGGNILDTLLRRPDFMAATRAAALDNDDELLWRCLQETLRFRHINPGPFRICSEGYTLAAGTKRARYVAPGTPVLASTQSAMFDSRRVQRPHEFNPHRPPEDYMVFGYGQHWCIGAYIAIAQITQTYKVLLQHQGLRRANGAKGRLKRITVYPANLHVTFDT
jgi:cytochrome P450